MAKPNTRSKNKGPVGRKKAPVGKGRTASKPESDDEDEDLEEGEEAEAEAEAEVETPKPKKGSKAKGKKAAPVESSDDEEEENTEEAEEENTEEAEAEETPKPKKGKKAAKPAAKGNKKPAKGKKAAKDGEDDSETPDAETDAEQSWASWIAYKVGIPSAISASLAALAYVTDYAKSVTEALAARGIAVPAATATVPAAMGVSGFLAGFGVYKLASSVASSVSHWYYSMTSKEYRVAISTAHKANNAAIKELEIDVKTDPFAKKLFALIKETPALKPEADKKVHLTGTCQLAAEQKAKELLNSYGSKYSNATKKAEKTKILKDVDAATEAFAAKRKARAA